MAEKMTKEQMIFKLVRQLNNIEEGMLTLLLNASDKNRADLFDRLQGKLKKASMDFVAGNDGCPKGQHRNEEGFCVPD